MENQETKVTKGTVAVMVGACVGAVSVLGGIAYGVHKFITKKNNIVEFPVDDVSEESEN